ncbi:hypothetical protein C8R44DRAFT_122968 [Mycena epipterygia]|nr:hypothetical protein C8R44DRAFT_122968 [Mycena epipterygia]
MLLRISRQGRYESRLLRRPNSLRSRSLVNRPGGDRSGDTLNNDHDTNTVGRERCDPILVDTLGIENGSVNGNAEIGLRETEPALGGIADGYSGAPVPEDSLSLPFANGRETRIADVHSSERWPNPNVSSHVETRLNQPDRQLTTEFKDPTPELPPFGHSDKRPAPPSAVDTIAGTDPTCGAGQDANPVAKLLTFMRSRFQSDQDKPPTPVDMSSRPTPSLPPPPPSALRWSQSTSSSTGTDSLVRAAQHNQLGGKIPNPKLINTMDWESKSAFSYLFRFDYLVT